MDSTYLEYLVDLRQVYFAPVFQLVDANFLAVKKEKTESHYLSSNEHTCLIVNIPTYLVIYLSSNEHTCLIVNTPTYLVIYLSSNEHTCLIVNTPTCLVIYLSSNEHTCLIVNTPTCLVIYLSSNEHTCLTINTNLPYHYQYSSLCSTYFNLVLT